MYSQTQSQEAAALLRDADRDDDRFYDGRNSGRGRVIMHSLFGAFFVLARLLNGPLVETQYAGNSPPVTLVLPDSDKFSEALSFLRTDFAESILAFDDGAEPGNRDRSESAWSEFPMHLTADVALIRREHLIP